MLYSQKYTPPHCFFLEYCRLGLKKFGISDVGTDCQLYSPPNDYKTWIEACFSEFHESYIEATKTFSLSPERMNGGKDNQQNKYLLVKMQPTTEDKHLVLY